MKRVILVRYGEIMLKGLNRPVFEDKLIHNIKKAVFKFGKVDVVKTQGRIFIEPQTDPYEFSEAMNRLTKVFGIVSVSPVWKIDPDFGTIREYSLRMVRELLLKRGNVETSFKVEAKRGDKKFPMESPRICSELGEFLLENIEKLRVDVHQPDFVLYVEVRESAYLYSEMIPASGGMPVGTNGKAMLLLSGGIDSPVAGWMTAKRGVELDAVHFYSYPYTSERAREKVIDLCRILAHYCFHINLHIVPFTELQLHINDRCPQDQMTIIMRRAMMRIAERLAQNTGSLALVTGESIGQVASQTIQGLAATNAVVSMPVFRPLIGMDKNEAVALARRIGTFETSILPYEDCCTVFTAKHPKTKPRIHDLEKAESGLDLENLMQKAIAGTEILQVKAGAL